MPGEQSVARPSIDARDQLTGIDRGVAMTDQPAGLRAALAYAARGWAVFPLHTPTEKGCSCNRPECRDVGKHPRTMHGLKDATTDADVIRRWWKGWPVANVGISTGPSGLVVIDIDPRHGGDESLHDLIARHGEDWIDTPTVLTGGGGTHYLYRAPADGTIRNAADVVPGIDIRGDGGYVVAPPSLHVSGGSYMWERTVNDIALLPYPTHILKQQHSQRMVATPGGIIPSGERNQQLTSMAGAMRRRGMGEAGILAGLREENAARCDPPLPASDLEKIARSVARYDPADDVVLKLKGGAPTYSYLRKHRTEPPVYVLRIGETDVRMDINTLMAHGLLRKRAMEQADIHLPQMSNRDWDMQVHALVDELEVIDAPEDASEGGIIWAIACEFLSGRSEIAERFAQGRPYETNGWVYTTGPMLREALRVRGVKSPQRDIWEAMRAHGTVSKVTHIEGQQYRVWAVPVEELS